MCVQRVLEGEVFAVHVEIDTLKRTIKVLHDMKTRRSSNCTPKTVKVKGNPGNIICVEKMRVGHREDGNEMVVKQDHLSAQRQLYYQLLQERLGRNQRQKRHCGKNLLNNTIVQRGLVSNVQKREDRKAVMRARDHRLDRALAER